MKRLFEIDNRPDFRNLAVQMRQKCNVAKNISCFPTYTNFWSFWRRFDGFGSTQLVLLLDFKKLPDSPPFWTYVSDGEKNNLVLEQLNEYQAKQTLATYRGLEDSRSALPSSRFLLDRVPTCDGWNDDRNGTATQWNDA